MQGTNTEITNDPLEKYFKNTIGKLLKEAVKRGIIKEDLKVKDLIKE